MMLAYETVEKAEDMVYCYEEAMRSILNAIDTLRNSKDETASEFAVSLAEILDKIEDDNRQYDEILEENETYEQEEMLREYWRAVI